MGERYTPRQPKISGLILQRNKAESARYDAIGLCVARLMDDTLPVGKNPYMQNMMGDLIQEPERLGAATLTIIGMLKQMANGNRPGGWGLLIDYLIDSIPEQA